MNRWYQLSLASRMALVMVLLLLIVQFISFWFVRTTVQDQARTEIKANLQVGERIFLRLLDQNAARLRDAAGVLASDFGFREAIGSGDTETIISALENSGERIGAEVVALLDTRSRLISAGQGSSDRVENTLNTLAKDLVGTDAETRLAIINETPYQFVVARVRSPLTVGWVLMGFPIDQKLVNDFHSLSGTHALVMAAQGTLPLQTIVSSLPFTPNHPKKQGLPDPDIYSHRDLSIEALGGRLKITLLRSIDEVMAPFNALQQTLALLTLASVALFALGGRIAAGRVTRPLGKLTAVTESLEKGDFNIAVDGTERHDEVGLLARGFERMRHSLDTQRKEILHLAYKDRLTGLPNREQFRLLLEQAIGAHPAQQTVNQESPPCAVIILNVDRFKHVNDILGYAFGDELLKAVALRLESRKRSERDIVARLSGDEFALLLHQATAPDALYVAENIMQAFLEPLALDDQTVDLSASMGIACWPEHALTAELLISRAEIAMYAAKARTDAALVYAAELDSSSAQNLSLLSDLRVAIDQGQLRLFLQPKVATCSGKVIGAEALVRWIHPQRGMIPPMQFIPFAEQTGFVRQLTLWMFEDAARQWHALQPADGALRIAINLSTRDLLDQHFPGHLANIMQRHGVAAAAFCLEITESAIMDDPTRAEATLNTLSQMGFKLSIDDFGTGYSSLAYLKRLPVNELKIDKSFVMGMAQSESDITIVRSTIDLAHNLGLSVVAEGVESRDLLENLCRLGCDEAQGYYISKPMPADQFPEWRLSFTMSTSRPAA